jgi:hypothetical protein
MIKYKNLLVLIKNIFIMRILEFFYRKELIFIINIKNLKKKFIFFIGIA